MQRKRCVVTGGIGGNSTVIAERLVAEPVAAPAPAPAGNRAAGLWQGRVRVSLQQVWRRRIQALRPALAMARQLAAQHSIALRSYPADDAGTRREIRVHADPERLQQVLGCMLDNAIRYSRPNGEVHLAVMESEDELTVQITDDGIGIETEDLPHIFTRGWRSPAARDHRPDGLGLGLAIARKLVLAQAGRLEIAPRRNGGVSATLRLAKTNEARADAH